MESAREQCSKLGGYRLGCALAWRCAPEIERIERTAKRHNPIASVLYYREETRTRPWPGTAPHRHFTITLPNDRYSVLHNKDEAAKGMTLHVRFPPEM
jgi:hypothetical protein